MTLIEHKKHHKKSGQWCFKCHKYIGKVKRPEPVKGLEPYDYLR